METVAMQEMNQDDADAADIMNINSSLMAAEKEASIVTSKILYV